MPDRKLAPEELAEREGVSRGTVRRWRATGAGPPFEKLTRATIRYALSEVETWERSRREGGEAR
jgi:predicted DNA-binding transcriptional regulator AlpA